MKTKTEKEKKILSKIRAKLKKFKTPETKDDLRFDKK